ncbi:NAD(+)--rifampin ADP-ribosyltransferase [Exiguobacterium sp. H66]|uniref:NAD(+)--rifampin ADP-ribosyltransferase n=1 Tax=Exiguobacterium sp. H66 TaxID=2751208 RepID=UPI001BE689FC|nr:NAD(+)--rifampin ADP-ribosyltransferase [Exiguobacterium sp. H66]
MEKPLDSGPFFHGTKASLEIGQVLDAGNQSNYQDKRANHIYFTATLDAAKWGAELARSDGDEHIYLVEPTGPYEDDPNLTDKKFPGNPTRSYRSKAPLKIVAELGKWTRHSETEIEQMRQAINKLSADGQAMIDD